VATTITNIHFAYSRRAGQTALACGQYLAMFMLII